MNICYLIRSFSTRGGTENYVYNMSMALAGLGHNVHIVSNTGKGQWDFKNLEDKIHVHQFVLREQAFRGSWRLEKILPLYTWRYMHMARKMLSALTKKYAIDIIEATDWGMDAWGYLPRRKVPVCVRLHGFPAFKENFDRGILKKGLKNYFLWVLFRGHILGADLVTGVSESYAGFVRRAWEIKKKDIQIIPIGIDSNNFHPTGVTRENNAILFAGRLEKPKGIEVLAQAIPLILKEIPNVKFYFAGRDFECTDRRETWSQRLIKNFGNEQVIYLGPLPTHELIRYYQSVTVSIVPSLYEPGGTVALEAMFCGCPVIASRVGGLEEAIKERQTGLLTPAGDARALADALIELLQKPQMRQQLSQKALEYSRKHFEINEIVQQTLDAYSHAIKLFKSRKSH